MTDKINAEKVIDILVVKLGWGRDSYAANEVRKSLEDRDLADFKAYEWRVETGSRDFEAKLVYGEAVGRSPRYALFVDGNRPSDSPQRLQKLANHLNATGFKP